jgi:hypothetical protein
MPLTHGSIVILLELVEKELAYIGDLKGRVQHQMRKTGSFKEDKDLLEVYVKRQQHLTAIQKVLNGMRLEFE